MSNDFSKQVAELIEDAFENLKASAATSPANPSDLQRAHALAQIQAAQAMATLHLAMEVRAVGLLLAASAPPALNTSAALAQEAYTAAVIHLGLVAEEPDTSTVDALRKAGLYPDGEDPADQDVEL